MIYFYQTVQLDALQMVLVGTTLEIAILLFEIPTGIVADLFSRRLSVIIGYVLVGCGIFLSGAVPLFGVILAAQLLWGLGATFLSGATEAWLSEEIGEAAANDAIIIGTRPEQIASILGIALAALIMPVNRALPMLIAGVAFIGMAIVLAIIMPENGFTPSRDVSIHPLVQMGDTFKSGLKMIRKRPALKQILILAVFFAVYTEGFDRLWIPFAMDQYAFPVFSAETWLGVAQITAQLAAFFILGWLHRKINLQQPRILLRLLIGMSFILFVMLVLSIATPWFWIALPAYGLIMVLREMHDPFYRTWFNQRLEPATRATVLSLSGQLDAVGQIIGGPMIGTSARIFSKRVGLGISTFLLAPALWIITRPSLREEALAHELKSPELPDQSSSEASI
ncbi:MAG TPA: MFS transporter [Desulfatirhabdiaceae bacterium]|nr:MFS transporter [Desulfatirhabdiaceae bacterium]